jgi:hypothetical protein
MSKVSVHFMTLVFTINDCLKFLKDTFKVSVFVDGKFRVSEWSNHGDEMVSEWRGYLLIEGLLSGTPLGGSGGIIKVWISKGMLPSGILRTLVVV